MARDYFRKLPKTSRDALSGNGSGVTNIIATDILFRYKIRDRILGDASLFYPYRWQEQDRPDTVAERYYGSQNFFWVVFYSNNFFDLNYDFPMDQQRFNAYLVRKYQNEIVGSSSSTSETPPVYFPSNIFAQGPFGSTTRQALGTTDSSITLSEFKALPIEEKNILAYQYTNSTIKNLLVDGFVVDRATFDASVGSTRRVQTLYDYEIEQNEAKRNVQLLDNEYLGQLIREYTKEISDLNAGRATLNRIYGETQ